MNPVRRITGRSVLLLAFAAVAFSGCKTYIVPLASFRSQYEAVGWKKSRVVKTQDPWGGVISYHTYPIDSIRCESKSGKRYKLRAGPAVEIRFTDTNNRRTVFFFDLLDVDSTQVTGYRSRIFGPAMGKTVMLGAVRKIEVQNGGKNYRYIR